MILKLYTMDEAATILRVSKTTLYRRVQDGWPHRRDGRKILFTEEDLGKIIENLAVVTLDTEE